MLLLMRKRIGSFVVKVFAFLLILGFGAWGIQDMLGYQSGGRGGGVAEVGDETLSPRALYSDVYAEIKNMRRFLGNAFDIEQAKRLGIVDGVLQRQIDAAATRVGAGELGIAISDGLVRQAIVQEPLFKGLAGNFDRERFQQILESNGLTEAGYVERLRQDLMTGQLVNSLGAGVVAPSGWVDAVYRYREERRAANTAFVADASVTAITEPTDAELRAHYKEFEKDFTAPEYRKLTYVRLDAADLAKEMEIAEADLREAYENRLDEFTTREKRKVRQMLLPDEAKAKAAAEQLAQGRDFLDVAKEIAGQEAPSVDLGEVTKEDLLPDVAGPVFALAKGAVSAPIKSSLGWHIMQATDMTAGGTKTFDEAKAALRDDIAHQRAVDAVFDLSPPLEDQLGGGAKTSESAAALDLKVHALDAIDQAGNDASGTALAGLPAGNFVGVAFATPEGQDSPMTEAGEDGFFILHVDTVTAPALRPFDSVREQEMSAWN
ncbi:MAG: SurA N-terminal domain-containing protein, partial [Rhodospirillaceae bacterium]